MPINFQLISSGAPLGSLPKDPINTTSSQLFYSFAASGITYEVSARLESSKYQTVGANDGGIYSDIYEHGSNLSLTYLRPQSLWKLSESSGNRSDSNNASANALTEVGGSIGRVAGPTTSVPFAANFSSALNQSLIRSDANLSAGFPGKSTSADTSITVGCWVKPATDGLDYGVLKKGLSYQILVFYNAAAFIVYSDGDSSSAEVDASYTSVPRNQWTHIVGRWDKSSGKLSIFINGVENGRNNAAISTMTEDSGDQFVLAPSSGYGGAVTLNGAIAEPFVFSSALTNSEIQDIYNGALEKL